MKPRDLVRGHCAEWRCHRPVESTRYCKEHECSEEGCKEYASFGDRCFMHVPGYVQCTAIRQNGKQCRRRAMYGAETCDKHTASQWDDVAKKARDNPLPAGKSKGGSSMPMKFREHVLCYETSESVGYGDGVRYELRRVGLTLDDIFPPEPWPWNELHGDPDCSEFADIYKGYLQ